MLTNKELEKIVNKRLNSNEYYLHYAMESFIKELNTIKASATTMVLEELKIKHPEVDSKIVESKITQMIEDKIKISIQIKFEE